MMWLLFHDDEGMYHLVRVTNSDRGPITLSSTALDKQDLRDIAILFMQDMDENALDDIREIVGF